VRILTLIHTLFHNALLHTLRIMRAAHAEAQTRLSCFFYSQSSCLTKRLLSANDTVLFNYNAAAVVIHLNFALALSR
jgi:hypothetical protein